MADREARRRAICTCQRRRALGHRVTIIVLKPRKQQNTGCL